jgi:hypothetical protein
MHEIKDRRTSQSAQETDGPTNIRRSQSLRLDKQIIRTLTGAELKLAGGGACTCVTCGHHTGSNNTK